MPLVRRSPLVSVGLRRRVGRGCTAISNRAVRGSLSSDLVRSAGFTGRCQE